MNKQIEEMAKIIDKAQKWHDIHCENTRQCEICEYHKGQVHCSSNYIAEDLFNAGYRNVHDFAKWHAEEQLKLSENVSKETAREILQEVSTIIKAIGKDYDLSGNQTLSMMCANIYNKVFDKLAENSVSR